MMTTGIVDLSHYEMGADLLEAQRGGIVAAIMQTTYGHAWIDPSAMGFVADAKRAGLLVAQYHFADGSTSGGDQADFFLTQCDPIARPILDLEWVHTTHGPMSLLEAEKFALRIERVRGRAPILYTSRAFIGDRVIAVDSPLRRCELWVPWYSDGPPRLPHGFDAWALWQYTDGKVGPRDQRAFRRDTPGLGRHADRSAFAGTPDELRAWWLKP